MFGLKAESILGERGALAQAIEGYEHRPSQIELAREVEAILANDGVLIAEVGTGTGKTWAYLVPAMLGARRVIVSTGTRALQDQIMRNDVPLLQETLGLDTPVQCMKGLANYVCLRRLRERLDETARVGRSEREELLRIAAWVESSQSGDRADLADLGEDAPIWAHVTSSIETRIGKRCPYNEACFVTRMRRAVENAQIIIVNHHLFFADLALKRSGASGVLPEYDALIFDEAHLLEDIATLFMSMQVSTARLSRLADDARRKLQSETVDRLSATVEHKTRDFFSRLASSSDGSRRELGGDDLDGDAQNRLFALDAALEALEHHCLGAGSADSDEGTNATVAGRDETLQALARRIARARDELIAVAEGAQGAHGARGRVSWVQDRGSQRIVGSTPIDVSSTLHEELFARAPAIVLTSATLSTSGGFELIRKRLGIELESRELLIPSPFRYEDVALLYIASTLPDPRDPSYADRAARRTVELLELSRGGAFVLCTSTKRMRELYAYCRKVIPYPVLLQGERPKADLLETFRRQGDAVLFATASFWQGVDVPGSALRLVIIDKLPFEVPSDPVVAARCRALEDAGERPFMRYLVPSAALALKQGFGRLVRSESDRGVVAILDSRIVRKGYGKVFLRSLPPARQTTELDDIRSFFGAYHA